MSNIEKLLKKEKKRIDEMKAPTELEERLRNTLNTTTRNSPKIPALWKTLAAAVLLTLLVGYNINGLAYYGKKILGFDDFLTGTLKNLNEAGMGQSIEKSYSLGNGVELTINGLMADSNQMLIYYTLFDPNAEDLSWSHKFNPSKMTGFFTNSNYEGGSGMLNEDGTELKGIMEFEPPSPFSKKLTLHFWKHSENGQMIEGKITFPYNPNKLMDAEIEQSINETIKVDRGTIEFQSITATPLMTVIEGSLNVENFDRVDLAFHGIELIANGEVVEVRGSGSSTSLTGGTTFELNYDALPKPLESLELYINEFVGYEKIDKTIMLKELDKEAFKLAGEDLWIKYVSKTSEGIEITIATEESVLLDEVFIETIQGEVELQTTINQTMVKQPDGTIMKERTLFFDTKEEPESLIIGGIHYMKPYDIKIDIPVD